MTRKMKARWLLKGARRDLQASASPTLAMNRADPRNQQFSLIVIGIKLAQHRRRRHKAMMNLPFVAKSPARGAASVTFSGTGSILMSANAANGIRGGSSAGLVNKVSISGSGTIGDGQMNLNYP